MKRVEKFKKAFRDKLLTPMSIQSAKMWGRIGWFRFRVTKFRTQYRTILRVLLFSVLVGVTWHFVPALQRTFQPFFSDNSRISDLKLILVSLGGALIGAGAISFSLVMFAMQINIGRMPHGLFGKFSSDRKNIAAFTGIFILGTVIASLSLFVRLENVALSIGTGIWSLVLIISLVVYAYRRTLILINPIQQLTKILDDTRNEMASWAKNARRAKPLLIAKDNAQDEGGVLRDTHDTALVAYFSLNSHWTAGSTQAINHAVSFARRYAENGDYTVSGNALNLVIEINRIYIETKGKTFFSDPLMMTHPLSGDGFINNTLEELRKTLSIGLSRKDEQQIEQLLNALAHLVILYSDIDYSSQTRTKQHAHLAVAYLSDGVQSALRSGYTDIVMQGLRLMGQAACSLLIKSGPNEMATLVKDIALISTAAIVNEKTRPVTVTGIEQLAMLTVRLLQAESHDIQFIAQDIRRNVGMIAKFLLQLPEADFSSPATMNLAPYYSVTNFESLSGTLTSFANALSHPDTSKEDAQRIIKNIEQWADEGYQHEKELLLLAVEKRSQFTFDMIHWIAKISKVLLAVSKAPACHHYLQTKLEDHAIWLFSTLSWIKDDKETVDCVEKWNMTETLFEEAFDSRRRGCLKFAEEARKLLIGWAFKEGKYKTRFSIFEKSIYALVTLAIDANSDVATNQLKESLTKWLEKTTTFDEEQRNKIARKIRVTAATLYREEHWSSGIEGAMRAQDHDKVKSLLEDIANIVSPGTASEPVSVRSAFF